MLGKVIREDLTNDEKVNYISHHFTPGKKFDLFITQSIVRGKTQQKKVLVFQHSWLDRYRWLVYSISVGGGLCKFCILFSSEKDKRKYSGVLVNRPFINLVKATGKGGILEHHQHLQYHKDAVQNFLVLLQHQKHPETDLSLVISRANKESYSMNLHILKSIVEAVIFCGKQNLPLRGHRDSLNSLSSNKGNLWAILEVMSRRDPILQKHLEMGKKNAQYTSKTIQNEIIDIVAEYIRKENTRTLENDISFFSIMGDEVTYPHSNQEILSVCLRMLDKTNIKEFFFDFVYLERATGESIAMAIIESVKKHHVDINKARGQCYDGASCMSSNNVGVQARIKQVSPFALYVHCHSHVLNLSIASACKLPTIRNMIDTLNSIFLFFDLSPKRQRFYEKILDSFAPDLTQKKLVGLCNTRWVERHML